MNFFSIILCCLFLQAFARPSHVLEDYDREANEDSYRDSDTADSDDYRQNEQKRSSLKQFSENEPKAEELDDNMSNPNEERTRLEKDYLNGDQTDTEQLSDIDTKRTADYSKGHVLFPDSNKQRKVQNNEYHSDDRGRFDSHGQYFMHDAVGRNRRQITNIDADEDKETAIKRHLKKLSKQELDELLQSLSEEKRSLLKTLIDDSPSNDDSVSKREITKKAGANEEPSLVSNDQSDTSKIQGSPVNLEGDSSMDSNTVKSDITKKADSESICSTSTEIANSSEKPSDKIFIINGIEDIKLEKSDNLSQPEAKMTANIDSDMSKKGNKREIISKSFIHSDSDINDPEDLGSSNNEDYCSDNEDLSKSWNGEFSSFNNNNLQKRQVYSDKTDSVKSLEESFPNADDTSNLRSESGMVPLVRVKRTNSNEKVEKRDANLLSNFKVPFFSSAVEEDSDEGSESQENGFYDKLANYATSGEINRKRTDSSGNINGDVRYCDSNSQSSYFNTRNSETDTANLGSDTDAVLSGIEGVDDNIMYNSIVRSKRTAVNNLDDVTYSNKLNSRDATHRGSQNEDDELSQETCDSALRYQENDAFGSLPRNSEEELGRFKRIRRLKPLVSTDNNISTVKQ